MAKSREEYKGINRIIKCIIVIKECDNYLDKHRFSRDLFCHPLIKGMSLSVIQLAISVETSIPKSLKIFFATGVLKYKVYHVTYILNLLFITQLAILVKLEAGLNF